MIIKRVHGSVGEMKKEEKRNKNNKKIWMCKRESKRHHGVLLRYTIVHSNLIWNCVINIHTHVHKI